MIPVYNESDIIEQVIRHLLSQGLSLVIVDNGSNDGSYEICRRYLQNGVLSIERRWTERHEWRLMLQRLFTMALQHSPDWAVLSGADEFLESPYRGYTFGEAIEIEARKGHNLIQFDNFEFWPSEKDSSSPETDVRRRIKYYSWHDDDQFRCWKVYPRMVIHEQGGHRPTFPLGVEQRISPNKFVLRHYKIRSYEHGLRKVFTERLPRYSPELRSMGWHVHYDNFTRDKDHFIIDSSKLTKYNEDGNWNLTKTFDGSFGAWNPPSARERLSQFEQKASEREQKLRILEEERNKLAAEVVQKTNTINEQEERLHTVEDERNRLASEIAQKTNTINEQEAILRKLGSEHLALVTRLDEITHSLGYKFMRFYASRIDRLLPERTGRGELKKILVTSARIATEQGLSSLLGLAREKIQERQFRVVGPPTADVDYALWMAKNEIIDEDLRAQRRKAGQLRLRPLISVVTPVWNPPPDFLADTIESVISQTYENWELCVVDGGSNQEVKKVLRNFADQDQRIRVQFLDRNLGISQNSNKAIESARGEFIALLDHDDQLAPCALFEIVNHINQEPDVDFIYSDKDSMTTEGKRFNPLFKPDWSPDTMLSANYVTHLCVIRTELVKSVGGFRPETDGAQDWDLFLRVAEKTNRIHHIPKVLYHWRLAPASVSSAGLQAKPYAAKAQLLTLNQHVSRNMRESEIRFDEFGHLRVVWKFNREPRVSVVVYSQDDGPSLHRCLTSILDKSSYKNLEVIVVSCDPTAGALQQEFAGVRFLESKDRLNYSSANNLGAAQASGDVLVFLDPYAEVLSADWLQELTGWVLQPKIGAVGAKLLHPSGEILHGGVVVGLRGYVFEGARERSWLPFGDTEWYRDYSAVSGLCMATSRRVFEELGHFEERSDTPDIGFCIGARRRNYRVLYTPYARLTIHHPRDLSPESPMVPGNPEYRRLFEMGDPCFNPNLSYEHSIPTLKAS